MTWLLPRYFFGSLQACPHTKFSLPDAIMSTSTLKVTLEVAHGTQHAV